MFRRQPCSSAGEKTDWALVVFDTWPEDNRSIIAVPPRAGNSFFSTYMISLGPGSNVKDHNANNITLPRCCFKGLV